MKIDSGLMSSLEEAGDRAAAMEAFGYDGLLTAELSHDPFFPLVLAAQRTERVELRTGIAVAFSRNPMLLANMAWDLQNLSKGRFALGLGSQIKAHITKRFSMPWSKPAARMQDMIEAIHAIWDSWDAGERLDHRGEFYQHTLMTPMFDPGPLVHGRPKIILAAVGPLMTKVAGRVADGFVSHSFQTEAYLREVTLPALAAGAAERGRDLSDVEISMPMFIISGTTEEEMAKQAQGTRQQIAFYGSTPAYKGVLDHHGWGDAQPELHRLSKAGKWVEMADVIDDEMLNAFAIVAEPDGVAAIIKERFGDIVHRMQFSVDTNNPDVWAPVVADIQAI